MENINIIDKNWKSLIKPTKLAITSNDDKSIAKVIAEPLVEIDIWHPLSETGVNAFIDKYEPTVINKTEQVSNEEKEQMAIDKKEPTVIEVNEPSEIDKKEPTLIDKNIAQK